MKKRNMERMIRWLRAPMPAGFEWDFTTVSQKRRGKICGCAIGLLEFNTGRHDIEEYLGISTADSSAIFVRPAFKRGARKITSAEIADELQSLLDTAQ